MLLVGEQNGKRDIVLRTQDNNLRKISETHRSYDPLQYPILFPRGEDGFSLAQPSPVGEKVTPMKFYAYRLMVRRQPDFNTLLRCRRAMQQYVVDMYVKIETDRLNFVRYHQKELRAETYSNFADALLTDNADPRDVGQKVVLPSYFSGGPRYMHQRTQDAMSYVRKFGKPSLLITMTCNPQSGRRYSKNSSIASKRTIDPISLPAFSI